MANESLLDVIIEYLIEDLTVFSVTNTRTDKLKEELKQILCCLDKIDLASIVTHYENSTYSAGKLPRLRQFAMKLQTVLGDQHQVCQALRNSELFKISKVNPNIKSNIVINLDQVSDPKATGDRQKKEELEEHLDSLVYESPTANKPADVTFESMINEKQHKRQRSVHHKRRKNMRSDINKAKKQLLNELNL